MPQLHRDPDRAQSAVARAIGFSSPAINRLLLHGMGGSPKMVSAVAAFLNESPARIMYGTDDGKEAEPQPNRHIRIRDLPGCDEALKDARKRLPLECPHVDVQALEEIADGWIHPPPRTVTASVLLQLAICHSPAPGPTKRRRG